MISTGLRIVTKSTDPVTWAINILQNLLSGVSFPVIYLNTIFFPGASTVSWFLPQTWVYHLCRLSMLTHPSLMDPKILLQYTGKYELGGAVIEVMLKDDNFLYLTVPGQPVYQLAPYKTHKFRIRQFADIVFEFVVENGKVVAMKQRDPSGEYRLNRK